MDLEDDAVVEYVQESFDLDALGLDAFSDVFKRFKPVADDASVRLFAAPRLPNPEICDSVQGWHSRSNQRRSDILR